MVKISKVQGDGLYNGEFITGPVLKQLILAGTLQLEKHSLELEEIEQGSSHGFLSGLHCACYEMSRCSSDSAGDIFLAAAKGINESLSAQFHPAVTFSCWFRGLATALRNNQEISAQNFAEAMHKAANSEGRRSGSFGTVPRKAAEAAEAALKMTQNIYELLEKTLEGARHDFVDKQQRQKTSMELAVILFLEGMQCYIEGNISVLDIEEKDKNIKSSELEARKDYLERIYSDKVKERELEGWVYHAVALLDATIFNETDNDDSLNYALKVRNLVHANFGKDFPRKETLEGLDELLSNLKTVYAPKSRQLALKIRNTISKLATSKGSSRTSPPDQKTEKP